jgi:hypothetical protein
MAVFLLVVVAYMSVGTVKFAGWVQRHTQI